MTCAILYPAWQIVVAKMIIFVLLHFATLNAARLDGKNGCFLAAPVSSASLVLFQVLANHQCRRGTFPDGAGNLFGAAAPDVSGGAYPRHAGLKVHTGS